MIPFHKGNKGLCVTKLLFSTTFAKVGAWLLPAYGRERLRDPVPLPDLNLLIHPSVNLFPMQLLRAREWLILCYLPDSSSLLTNTNQQLFVMGKGDRNSKEEKHLSYC